MAEDRKIEDEQNPVPQPEELPSSPEDGEKNGKKHEGKAKHKQEKEVELLRQEVEKLKQEKANLEDAYKRKVAEFDNYKKRVLKEMEDMRLQANKKLLQHILPVYDSLSRAVLTLENTSVESLRQGINIIFAEFSKVMNDAGVKPIECVGQEFDYSRHEALMMEEREDVPYVMTVIQELEKGYMLGEEVLRPSKVKVAKKVTKQDASESSETSSQTTEKN
ncbi:nucleotide exchange factor GrpE [Thermospira aquatica]|uniref:Protein GrpE n=1 Tax=Thermospira aquatica TaxID=2828656 RepID=A0AAX3BBU3_9SPIR|nr:nucleotide exchange factor GrpE [Thermospira aquatica]URA09541.1 nucleotide exchange factor GrpE [Thermospira aquatica]